MVDKDFNIDNPVHYEYLEAMIAVQNKAVVDLNKLNSAFDEASNCDNAKIALINNLIMESLNEQQIKTLVELLTK